MAFLQAVRFSSRRRQILQQVWCRRPGARPELRRPAPLPPSSSDHITGRFPSLLLRPSPCPAQGSSVLVKVLVAFLVFYFAGGSRGDGQLRLHRLPGEEESRGNPASLQDQRPEQAGGSVGSRIVKTGRRVLILRFILRLEGRLVIFFLGASFLSSVDSIQRWKRIRE